MARSHNVNRRKISLSIILLLAGAATSNAQDAGLPILRTSSPYERGLADTDFPRVTKIATGVYTFEALTGSPDDRYTTNSMFVITDDGVLVADGQGNVEDSGRLVDAIAKITDQPISHVIICSDHGDHTNGNAAFPDSAEFIAHRNSLEALSKIAENTGVMPDTIVDERLDLRLGSRDIQVLFLGRAHTGGDLFVYPAGRKDSIRLRSLS